MVTIYQRIVVTLSFIVLSIISVEGTTYGGVCGLTLGSNGGAQQEYFKKSDDYFELWNWDKLIEDNHDKFEIRTYAFENLNERKEASQIKFSFSKDKKNKEWIGIAPKTGNRLNVINGDGGIIVDFGGYLYYKMRVGASRVDSSILWRATVKGNEVTTGLVLDTSEYHKKTNINERQQFEIKSVDANGVPLYFDAIEFYSDEAYGKKGKGYVLEYVINEGDCAPAGISDTYTGDSFLGAPETDEPTAEPTTETPTTKSPTKSPTPKPTHPSAYLGGGTKDRPDQQGVKGDPHFKTWDGQLYDFHGVCDLVLLQNSQFRGGLGMDIHIRTTKTRQWSSTSNVVVRIGRDTFEVAADKKGLADTYYLNSVQGKPINFVFDKYHYLPTAIAGYPISVQQKIDTKQILYEINLSGYRKEKIQIFTWKGMVRVDIMLPSDKHFHSSVGLMGSYELKGAKIGRDNKKIFHDDNDFGEEWQVLSNEPKLFHDKLGDGPIAPTKCTIPSKTAIRRRLSESNISIEEAMEACSSLRNNTEKQEEDFDLCVFDVMVTGDTAFAGAY